MWRAGTPKGKVFNQQLAENFSQLSHSVYKTTQSKKSLPFKPHFFSLY